MTIRSRNAETTTSASGDFNFDHFTGKQLSEGEYYLCANFKNIHSSVLWAKFIKPVDFQNGRYNNTLKINPLSEVRLNNPDCCLKKSAIHTESIQKVLLLPPDCPGGEIVPHKSVRGSSKKDEIKDFCFSGVDTPLETMNVGNAQVVKLVDTPP